MANKRREALAKSPMRAALITKMQTQRKVRNIIIITVVVEIDDKDLKAIMKVFPRHNRP